MDLPKFTCDVVEVDVWILPTSRVPFACPPVIFRQNPLLELDKFVTLQAENIKDVIMCTFNITLDDALLERVRPAFASEDALREWMTGKIETLLLNYNSESPTVRPCAYSDEEMYFAVKERLQNLENGTAEAMDGEEFLSQIRTRYGIEA